ncbi:peptidase M50 [Candidatus Gracilibacteria bacterium]|nr:peptidase M50 [Candidatus Gracilibacteria bacterium]
MNWSLPLGRLAGFDIKLHITFFLLVPLAVFPWGMQYGAVGVLFGAVLLAALFFCIALHELGHALAARRYGIKTREILLLPLGGLAILDEHRLTPRQELVIALAGPLVTFLVTLALFFGAGAAVAAGALELSTLNSSQLAPSWQSVLVWLLELNTILLIFNLIPAFPLDGGRALRAGLAMAITEQRATQIATMVGQGIAALLVVAAVLTSNVMLGIVALFIFLGARQEQVQGRVMTVLTSVRAGDIVQRQGRTLQIGDRLSAVVEAALVNQQHAFAVMQGERILGAVLRSDVTRALNEGSGDTLVQMLMRRELPQADSNDTLDTVRLLFMRHGSPVIAVFEHERFIRLAYPRGFR